jgi:hypothetical protein
MNEVITYIGYITESNDSKSSADTPSRMSGCSSLCPMGSTVSAHESNILRKKSEFEAK